MRNISLLIALLMATPSLIAETVLSPEPLVPPKMISEEEARSISPDVTIKRKKEKLIEEYSINGRVYMIKVTPSKGYPYYLIDTDGDGELDSRSNELDPGLMIPSWIIFRW